MRFAKWVFTLGGIYGLITLAPMYLLEGMIGQGAPLPHPEYFYGFVGLGVAWQVLFLMIGRDPVRLRPAMLAGIVEKLSFGLAVPLLIAQGRVAASLGVFAAIDLMLAALFAVSWLRTRPATP